MCDDMPEEKEQPIEGGTDPVPAEPEEFQYDYQPYQTPDGPEGPYK